MIPGEILPGGGAVPLNAGRPAITLLVTNTGDRPVQVGSHYHFAQANPALDFDRAPAQGHRLDIPAGTAVRFEPGIAREVSLVPLGGRRVVPGLRLPTAPPDPDQAGAAENGTAPTGTAQRGASQSGNAGTGAAQSDTAQNGGPDER